MYGLIQLYCGDGKGKTTAAVGAAVRCAGAGGKVLFFQFMKGNKSSELAALSYIPNIIIEKGYDNIKFIWDMDKQEKDEVRSYYKKKLIEITNKWAGYDMVIFDEIISAISCEILDLYEVMEAIRLKPKKTELILTGRDPDDKIQSICDYISEIKSIKHPYDIGIEARKGIEY